jgi:hypothetical protein
MPWSSRLSGRLRVGFTLGAFVAVTVATCAAAADSGVWSEYGLVHTEAGKQGKLSYTAYRFKDLTGALAAWEWQRSPEGKPCDQAAYCTQDGARTIVFQDNYLLVFNRPNPPKPAMDAVIAALPGKTDTELPAILTFIPRQGLVPDSARYVLGKESLSAFAPELAGTDPGFAQGAEAQVAQYKLDDQSPVHLAIFYYATPEMARLHSVNFRLQPGTHVKRSGVLVAVVFGGANDAQADTLLSRVEYEAKITWNDTPPPPPIKPLYRLLLNIIYASIAVSLIGLTAGLFYAGMRLYRRKYGQLEADEAMTTLHLT